MSDVVPLTGEPLALDLVNTRPRLADGPADLLATPDALAAWLALQSDRLAGSGLKDPPAPDTGTWERLTAGDVAAVHAVREHVAAAIDHVRRGGRPPAAALEGLNAAQRAAPAIRELTWDGTSVTAARRRTGPLGGRLAA
ncbi:ABATE domain-containing protein, partial [Nonomuraea sp. NPDC005501]|uniref:ABATE domain-containing protein n=1 Tax=Nonomuraea sp. NPDC005501 TaxID=3156884 RepID=UPI00339FFAD6